MYIENRAIINRKEIVLTRTLFRKSSRSFNFSFILFELNCPEKNKTCLNRNNHQIKKSAPLQMYLYSSTNKKKIQNNCQLPNAVSYL